MKNVLGIVVTTPVYIDYLFKIIKACKKKNKEIKVFIDSKGVHIINFKEFNKLKELISQENLYLSVNSLLSEGYNLNYIENKIPFQQLKAPLFYEKFFKECEKVLVL